MTQPSIELSDEVKEAMEHLKASLSALENQLTNPRAWLHHRIEAAQAVESDIRWLIAMLQAFPKNEVETKPGLDTCRICKGRLRFLGTLARTNHYRCENCGTDQFEEP